MNEKGTCTAGPSSQEESKGVQWIAEQLGWIGTGGEAAGWGGNMEEKYEGTG